MFRKVPSGYAGYVTAPRGLGHNDYGIAMPKSRGGCTERRNRKHRRGGIRSALRQTFALSKRVEGNDARVALGTGTAVWFVSLFFVTISRQARCDCDSTASRHTSQAGPNGKPTQTSRMQARDAQTFPSCETSRGRRSALAEGAFLRHWSI
jgi:hypothetical protein